MNNIELTYLIIGVGITLFSDIVFALIKHFSNYRGYFSIYKKVVYSKASENTSFQIIKGDLGKYLQIPMKIEFVNTKNMPYVVRNLNLVLFYNDSEVAKMEQCNYIALNQKENEDIFFGDMGKYSFIVKEKSVSQFELEFALEDNKKEFNQIVLRYHDSKDDKHDVKLADFPNGWNSTESIKDLDWIKIL